jgi:hypothetical protein
VELTDAEAERIAVHEAGHAVCGVVLGGTLAWVAIGQVGLGDFPEENEDTLGSTKCDFPKPWLSGTMNKTEETSARIEFCAKSICQTYAGVLAEEIVLGKWPDEGHSGDFDRINFFIKTILTLHSLPYTSENSYAIDLTLRQQTQHLLSTPVTKNAIRILADALRQRKRIESAEASEIIRTALTNGDSQQVEISD